MARKTVASMQAKTSKTTKLVTFPLSNKGSYKIKSVIKK